MEVKKQLAKAVLQETAETREELRKAVARVVNSGTASEDELLKEATRIGDQERQAMQRAIYDAGQFFDRGERKLALVAMPVGTLMQTPYAGVCQMDMGVKQKLRDAGRELVRKTGAERVVMDGRLYSVNALRRATIAELSQYADDLEADAKTAKPLGEPSVLRSSQSPEWQLTYFLAVCVFPTSQPYVLDRAYVVDRLIPARTHVSEAISEHMELVDNEVMEFEVDAYGFFYLRDGIRGGLNGFRGARLRNFLKQTNLAVARSDAYYAVDSERQVTRLLLVNGRERLEFVWSMEDGEDIDGTFVPAMREALSEIDVGTMQAERLAFEDYVVEARKAGMVWVGAGQKLPT